MSHQKTLLSSVATSAMIVLVSGCTSSDSTTPDTDSDSTIPEVFSENYTSAVTLSATATTVTLESEGVPDHKSPYWPTTSALWEEQIDGHIVNPGNLLEQTFVMTIPINPVEATTKEETSLGPIGMAINGVAIYNDREGGNVPVDAGTLLSFDAYVALTPDRAGSITTTSNRLRLRMTIPP
jgi:hypothetical protein